MITCIEDLVIFSFPFIWLYVGILACLLIGDVFLTRGVCFLLSAVLTTVLIVVSIFFGAKYQEVLLALMLIFAVQIVDLKKHGQHKISDKQERNEEQNKEKNKEKK